MKKTILCVDDMQTNLFIIQSLIEDMADDLYDVVLAKSASEALSVLLKQHIDLILLDIMMPEIDGLSAAKMIRSNKRTKNIPIIFVTAKKDDETISQCYEVGGDDYVNKPFNHVELLSRISFHLASKEKDLLLLQEKDYAQNILDLQDNLIMVTDYDRPITVNSALLKFYDVETLEELQNKYVCICHTFIEEEDYFNSKKVLKDVLWLDEIISLSKSEDVLVKIIRKDRMYIFNIKVKSFLDQYIVTLTDITQVSQLSLEYKHEANYDALTQIYNRNMFQRLIDRKIHISKTNMKSFVFIIFDIDFFKKVNDIHGHLVGDDVLINLTLLIKNHIRDEDIFARFGGEEFVLTFDVGIKKGTEIAESLRKYIENESFDVVDKITSSFGVTEFQQTDTVDTLIKRADDALYEAKDTGRNKVCVSK